MNTKQAQGLPPAIVAIALAAIGLFFAPATHAWLPDPQCTNLTSETNTDFPEKISCSDLNDDKLIKDAAKDLADACILSFLEKIHGQVDVLSALVADLIYVPEDVTVKRVATTFMSSKTSISGILNTAKSLATGGADYLGSCAKKAVMANLARNFETFKSYQTAKKSSDAIYKNLSEITKVSGVQQGVTITIDTNKKIHQLQSQITQYSSHLQALERDWKTIRNSFLGERVADELELKDSTAAVEQALGVVADIGAVDSAGGCIIDAVDGLIQNAQQTLAQHRGFVLERRQHYSKAVECIREGQYPAPSVSDWERSRFRELRGRFEEAESGLRAYFATSDAKCDQLTNQVAQVRARGTALESNLNRALSAATNCDRAAATRELDEVRAAMDASKCLATSAFGSRYYATLAQARDQLNACAGVATDKTPDINVGPAGQTFEPNRYYKYVIYKEAYGTWHWNNYKCLIKNYEVIQETPTTIHDKVKQLTERWNTENEKCKAKGCERSAGFSRIWRPERWSLTLERGPLESYPTDVPGNSIKEWTGTMTN